MLDKAIKVLFFGDFSENSTNISQANAFEKNGCKVSRYDFRRQHVLYEDDGYDLIFYSKCNELGIDAVQKYKGIKCLWYMDPLNGNYNDSLKAKFPYVNFICFALYEPYAKSLNARTSCHLIEEGFDPDVDYMINEGFITNIGFIGNLYNKSRQDYFKEVLFSLLKCSREQHPYVVNQTKINLNFCDGGTSDRSYKIMAAGGFLLSEPWPGCPFKPGLNFDIFHNAHELRNKIDYYLKHDEKRKMIAANGKRAVQKYSRTNWAKRILDIYKQCKS